MKMNIIKWITSAGLVMQTLLTVAATKPNIVLILIDNMGYGDIAPFGSTLCKTPALDRMANEGIKFTSFYAAPVCSAFRAQIQTGCYASRVSIPGVLPPCSAVGLNPEENTVAKLLKAQGYATMCIGKWHLGDQPEFFPTNYGYDHYFGIPYSNDMMRPKSDTGEKVVPLMHDNKVVELMNDANQDHLVRRYTEEAVKFIRESKREPTLAWWPGSIPAGRVIDAVTGEIDLLPTFVALAGGKVPTDRPIDGADISKILLGQRDVSSREAHYYYRGYKMEAVRSDQWKLALEPQQYSMGFKENAEQHGEKEPGLRLYNLVEDIGKTTNVAEQHPEVVKKLKALADKKSATLYNGSEKGPGVRVPGRVANPQFLYPVEVVTKERATR
jgi:arylsulfatase A-like enzyme